MPVHCLKWSLALIAGGGTAGLVQSIDGSSPRRPDYGHGRIGQPRAGHHGTGGAVVTSVLAIMAPLIAISLVVLVGCLIGIWLLLRRGRKATA